MDNQCISVMIDNGSAKCKLGFSGEDAARVFCPNLVGIPKFQSSSDKNLYIGNECLDKKSLLNLNSPIHNGIITNWDQMEKFWHFCFFNELKINPEENAIHMSECPINPKKNKEKMTEIMFECFKVPKFYVSKQSALALIASGRTTGVVLDSGYGVTTATSIYEEGTIEKSIMGSNLAGAYLTEFINNILFQRGFHFDSDSIAKEIKEEICYVALNYESDLEDFAKSDEKEYNLPDGKKIILGKERIICTEIMFNPKIIGKDYPGIHQLIYESISKCHLDIKKCLYDNIVLAGGNTMFRGIEQRLNEEILALAPWILKSKICATAERRDFTWIGGSILSSLNYFQTLWITKTEYEENGSSIVHKKCFY